MYNESMKCNICGMEKDISLFRKAKNTKSGYCNPCKECSNKRNAISRSKNKKYYSIHNKEWRKKNAEWNRERKRKWNAENYEEKIKPYQQQYRLTHREEKYSSNRKYRNLKLSCEGSHTEVEWLALLKYYENQCLSCGSKENLSRDHIIPLSKRGSDYIENIQPLCRSCNSKKKDKEIDFRGGNIYVRPS